MSEVQHHHTDDQQLISLSPAASNHLINYLRKLQNKVGVRLSLKTAGCSGHSYVLEPVQTVISDDIPYPLNDGLRLFIERKSYPLLKGLHIDYVNDGFSSKFSYTNPNQTGQCGCGESFTVDELP